MTITMTLNIPNLQIKNTFVKKNIWQNKSYAIYFKYNKESIT